MNKLAIQIQVMAVLLGIVLNGCSSNKPAPPPPTGPSFSYVIQADEHSLAGAAFQVDVLEINSSTRHDIEDVSIPDYFKIGSAVRQSAPILTQFTLAPGQTQRLDLADPQYQRVRFPNASHIAVLAYPPGDVTVGKNGDPRRVLLPLDPNKWPRKWPGKKREITITITRSLGIRVEPGWIDNSP
jgi:hypothetical protein